MSHPNPSQCPFAVLGVEPSFDLDLRRLRTTWMLRAAQSHPDAAGGVQESSSVNDAYRMLLDPVERARQMLRVLRAPEVDERRLPDGFLLDMLELRERADQESGVGRDALMLEARERREAALTEVRSVFGRVGGGTIDAVDAQAVHVQLNVIRAFDRMVEQLEREASA